MAAFFIGRDMIILGLGTNLGDKHANLNTAIEQIERRLLHSIMRSKILTFSALVPKDAPESWNIDFLNMAISGELKTEITPHEFLQEVKKIEAEVGRKPTQRWAPREIDIDILAWHEQVFEDKTLQIPHSAMAERDFVMIPFAQVAPNWTHPKTGQTSLQMLAKLEPKLTVLS